MVADGPVSRTIRVTMPGWKENGQVQKRREDIETVENQETLFRINALNSSRVVAYRCFSQITRTSDVKLLFVVWLYAVELYFRAFIASDVGNVWHPKDAR